MLQAPSESPSERVVAVPEAGERAFSAAATSALLLGGLLMLLIVAGSIGIAVRNGAALQAAVVSQDIRAATVDLLSEMQDAETGQRGYLLTGRDDYLLPYQEALRRVPGQLAALRAATRRSPELSREWAEIDRVVEDKLAELAETIGLARAGHRDAAMAIILSDRGKQDMDSIRGLATALAQLQRGVLIRQLGRSQAGTRLLVGVEVAAFAVLATVAGIALLAARRYVSVLRAARAGLHEANARLVEANDRLDATVRERTSDLLAANEEIQRFAYIISHDLRAPLLNIIGFTSELERATGSLHDYVSRMLEQSGEAIPDEVRSAAEEDLPEAIRFIKASTAKMDRLINAILRLSREGRRVLAPERLDLGQLIGGIIDSLRHQAEESGAELVLGEMPAIVSDRVAVEQIFSNLLENALKYLKPGRPGRIRVVGGIEGGMVRIEVQDNGRGIAARDRERVFELFRRAGNQDVPGEGIGLAHVRALVRRMGGRIDYESTLDVGSTFRVYLPLVLAHAAREAA